MLGRASIVSPRLLRRHVELMSLPPLQRVAPPSAWRCSRSPGRGLSLVQSRELSSIVGRYSQAFLIFEPRYFLVESWKRGGSLLSHRLQRIRVQPEHLKDRGGNLGCLCRSLYFLPSQGWVRDQKQDVRIRIGHATVLRDETAAGFSIYLAGIWLDDDVRNPRIHPRVVESEVQSPA